jgi:ABC-type glutathione transport system ATPase component
MNDVILAVKGLTVSLRACPGTLILDDVSLAVPKAAIVGVVGASGSGKTTLGLLMLGLVPPAMQVKGGKVVVEGLDILSAGDETLRQVRGSCVSMSFQEPMGAFDPVFSVGDQILEAMAAHNPSARHLARQKMLDLLSLVEVPDPVRVAGSYPHELSGGLCQRAMLALSLAARPAVLVADEPTSSLDVTLQARVMALFRKLRRELGLSIVLIAHDLGMVERLADETIVLCRGRVVGKDDPHARALMLAGEI